GAAGPERVLVELDALLLDATEHHRAEPAVAKGQRFHPLRGGLPIPERERAGRGVGLDLTKGWHDRGGGEGKSDDKKAKKAAGHGMKEEGKGKDGVFDEGESRGRSG